MHVQSAAIVLALMMAFDLRCKASEPEDLGIQIADGFQRIAPELIGRDGASLPLPRSCYSGTPILMPDESLILIYADGGERFADNSQIRAAVSTDHGLTWNDDRTIERNPEESIKHGRPTALVDSEGVIHVFYFGFVRYTKDPATSQSDMWTVRSRDGGCTWGERQRIWTGYTGMTEPAIELRSGRLLVPLGALASADRFAACVVRSDDSGQSWTAPAQLELPEAVDAEARARGLNGGALEPTVCELADGRVLLFVRTVTGRFWQSVSSDDGETWPPLTPSSVGCGGTGTLQRLRNGNLMLIHNPADASQIAVRGYPHGYAAQALSISEDEGTTWSAPLNFVQARRTVHSVGVETQPGKLLLTLPEIGVLLVRPIED
jgi:hypothetical protein